jgi:SAM-dependent methyltransferase
MVNRDFNQEAKPQAGKQYIYDFDEIVRHYMIRSFKPFFTVGSALEVGCYEGDAALLLSQYFNDLTVSEASTDALSIAKAKLPKSTTCVPGIFEEADFGRKFDNVFLINMLEHTDDAVRVLDHARKYLAPGGRCFVLVPNANAPSRQIAVQMGLIEHNSAVTKGEWDHGHRRTYALDTLERDIRAAGLVVEQRGGLMFKALANFQMDKALKAGIIDQAYLDGIYSLGMIYPTMCASIYIICKAGAVDN